MKPTTEYIISTIKEQGIIPLFYHDDKNVSIAIVDTLYKAGIRIVEYTNRGKHAIENFKALLAKRVETWPELLLSVGTIKTTNDAKNFIDAGADFVICPGVIPEVANIVQDAGLLWIPGCMTTTEIIIAEQHGAKLVKIFPGSLLGPSYIKAINDIFPEMMFMPTGGVEVNEGNLQQWFDAGVVAVGIGSKLISKEFLNTNDYPAIEVLAKKAIAIIQSINN
ncbi:MAG: bifunctional 4-hydroxy-2-oxoglutarate aldolase/2-dehydro-3-deoxy-phosphogluconate aldolase [Bacteroidetes bacterium]|nr:bifunctional 4-hydroxy-2-oxoglutarate aldolase/2-dehydro-3-deoxy-phosphogluconate aldolase [Bacteroidota bacterium]